MASLVKDLLRRKTVEHILRDVKAHSEAHGPDGSGDLRKTLGVWDLTFLGVAAIIGAGIFSTIGNAAAAGGPAVVFLFLLTALACCFSALCYAQFASTIPIAGSAYTYAYASFGEIFAWIIGWDLLCEYAIGNIAVAISWSEYFVGLIENLGIKVPIYLTMDFMSASRAFDQVKILLAQGQTLQQIGQNMDLGPRVLTGYQAWTEAPRLFGSLPLVCNLPALFIVTLITAIVYWGIQESKILNNALVLIKITVVLMVITIGSFYIHPHNWIPFAPHGVAGVLKGVSAVFFAYIGFDAISTTAEECKDPQRDMPRGMIYSLIICTILYVAVSLVLTGMVSYTKLQVGDPLAFVFGPQAANVPWMNLVVAMSAVVALSTVILVFQIGQPRIWMAMSRDGLLPKIFSAIHPKHKTPWFSTILVGFVVAIPSLFLNLTEVTDLTSIGTLFAFVLVCAGVLKLDGDKSVQSKFQITYVNSKYIFPALLLIAFLGVYIFNHDGVLNFFSLVDPAHPELGGWNVFQPRIPLAAYLILMVVLAVLSFRKNLSLIPVLGLATCGYLMTELGIINWIRFSSWLIVGFFVYFLYGSRHSKLNPQRVPRVDSPTAH